MGWERVGGLGGSGVGVKWGRGSESARLSISPT